MLIRMQNSILDLIELAFATIKDINIEFEIGIYFIDPDSNDYVLKDSTSKTSPLLLKNLNFY